MVELKRNGRHVRAMCLDKALNGVRGVMQCAIDGCEAYEPILGDERPYPQIESFLLEHDCNPNRFKPRRTLVVEQRPGSYRRKKDS